MRELGKACCWPHKYGKGWLHSQISPCRPIWKGRPAGSTRSSSGCTLSCRWTVESGNGISAAKMDQAQLTRLVDEAPAGGGWLHEIKYDGSRMHARIDGRKAKLLTRTGLDWSHRYRRTIESLGSLKVKSAYLDGELCGLNSEGVPVFSRLQAAMDEGRTDQLVFFAFDLLFLNGEGTAQLPLIKRKERLQRLFRRKSAACATANTLLATVLSSARKPASLVSKAPSRSKWIGPMHEATAEFG